MRDEQTFPGRVLNLKVTGACAQIRFEMAPWAVRIDDLNGAIKAFETQDLSYFHRMFWVAHPHLERASKKLTLVAPHLDDNELYSPERIISLSSFLGFYGTWDMAEVEQDMHRLRLIPNQLHWPSEGFGHICAEGKAPQVAWYGRMWKTALENMHVTLDLKHNGAAYRRAFQEARLVV